MSTATSATSSPATATSPTPSTAPLSPRCGRSTRARSQARASPPRRSSRPSTTAPSRACCRSASTRRCPRPTATSPPRRSTSSSSTRSSTSSSPSPPSTPTWSSPGSLHEEDEGTSTSGEGRIIKINAAVTPPGEARRDWEILLEIAERLGKGEHFRYEDTARDLRGAVPGLVGRHGRLHRAPPGSASRPSTGCSGRSPRSATPARLGSTRAVGSPTPTARPASTVCRTAPPAEVVDDDYPVWLTTGRVVSQYLSGTQTRRIASLVEQYPEPLCEIHPRLADALGIADGDQVTVRSRRGEITLPAAVVTTIRPDTVFIPYHWPGAKAANQLTNRAVDPLSKMPEFKVAAVARRPRAEERAGVKADPLRHRRQARSSSSTRAAASAARPASRPAPSAARTAATRSSTSSGSTGPRAPRPRRWSACTAKTRRAPRSVPPTPSSRPRRASCSRRSSPAASAARTA